MKKKNYIHYVAALLGLLVAASGCQSDEEWTDDNTVQMPVSFLLQSAGMRPDGSENNGRSAESPQLKNPRKLYADRVQLNVYRRAEGTYADDKEGFTFDRTMTLKCVESTDNSFRKATGTLLVEKGYEYRTTALAYSEEKQEKDLFSLTHGTAKAFGEAQMTLTDTEQYKTPELFFGTPLYDTTPGTEGDGTPLFIPNPDVETELRGVLYRCVAGVELTLTEVPENVAKLTLLAGKLNTQSKATVYDDFLDPTGLQETDAAAGEKFVIAQWMRPADDTAEKEVLLTDANLLAVDASPLYVKITLTDGTESIVHIRIKHKGADNTGGGYPGGGSGTGIIPNPGDKPDDSVINDGNLNFKRNNYYRIKGNYKQLTTTDLPLVVTINPYWDGDHELDMDKK